MRGRCTKTGPAFFRNYRLLMKIKIDSKLYKRILGYSKPYFGLIALGMILASVVSAMNGATAWLVKPVLDDIFLAKNMTMLKLLPLAVVFIYLVK